MYYLIVTTSISLYIRASGSKKGAKMKNTTLIYRAMANGCKTAGDLARYLKGGER